MACPSRGVLIGGLGIEFGLPLLAMALGAGGLFGIALPLYDSYAQQFLHATDPQTGSPSGTRTTGGWSWW